MAVLSLKLGLTLSTATFQKLQLKSEIAEDVRNSSEQTPAA